MTVMPNLRGGKAYKKGKKGPAEQGESISKFFKREADQDYARVIRMLGNRRVVCFCNDGRERVCKIRGALCKGPKKKRIDIGDIVLISFRDFEDSDTEATTAGNEADPTGNVMTLASGRKDIADIIDKFHREHWRQIKKEDDIHKFLFSVADQVGVDEIFDYGNDNDDDDKSEDLEEGDVDESAIDAI